MQHYSDQTLGQGDSMGDPVTLPPAPDAGSSRLQTAPGESPD